MYTKLILFFSNNETFTLIFFFNNLNDCPNFAYIYLVQLYTWWLNCYIVAAVLLGI